jgi:hypothetical protein
MLPAKSGKEENSIENATNGLKIASPAVGGTRPLTVTADEASRSTFAGTAVTTVAPRSRWINMAQEL